MYLVDTSVWIETFRRDSPLELQDHLDLEEIVLCLPVIQEVLQGFRNEAAHGLARESLLAFPIVESPLQAEVFDAAVELYRAARRVGLTVRSGIDCVIAACALRSGLTVLHRDRDFVSLAQVSPLRQRDLGAYPG